MGTNRGTASQVSGWFVEFQLAALRALPRDIDQETAEGWRNNGEALAKAFRDVLIPPASEPAKDGPHAVDCDATPKTPSGWKIDEHRPMGQVTLENRNGKLFANGKEVVRFLSPNQNNGRTIRGHELRKELADKPVLNACVRDYLLEHPGLIPEDWKQGITYFWGTIYRNSDGYLYVTCLHWNGDRWRWDYYWLDGDWYASEPAAVVAG